MKFTRAPLIACLGLVATACGTTSNVYHSPDALPSPLQPSVVVLPPDVVVSSRTAGGVMETHAGWSQTVATNLGVAIQEHLYEIGVRFALYGDALRDEDMAVVRQVNVLLDAIELSQLQTTIGGDRDYILGENERVRLREHNAEYALLIAFRANRATAGRVITAVLAGMGGVALSTSDAQFRAALIDLRDGHVKWANFDPEALTDIGDLTKASADKWRAAVRHLLNEFPL